MRKTMALLLALALSWTACGVFQRPGSTPSPQPLPTDVAPQPTDVTSQPTDVASRSPDTVRDDRAIYAQGLIEAERPVLDRLPGATVYHIDLRIPADFERLQGQEQVCYTNREDVPLDEIYLRLYPNVTGGEMRVSAVQVDGKEVTPSYEYAHSALRVPLPLALQPGGQVVLKLDYAVQVPREMGGNYGLFGYFDNVLVLDEFYPAVAVYDDEGWNVEIPPRNGDLTYYDASFYRVRVTAPAGLTVVASGIEVKREDEAGNQVLTYVVGPARDFYIAASEQYTRVSGTVGETTIHSYAFKGRVGGARLALRYATDALKSYNARYGTYPYNELDVLSTPMRALGIEYPGAVGITLRLYDPAEEVYGAPSRVVLESVIAHEVAHQWFYNAVGNDQVDEPWLDEALVQYVTGLYYQDVHGASAAQGYRDSWASRWDGVDRAAIPIGLPSARYTREQYSPIVYGRGPFFIQALAEELGQPAFDAFLRDYYTAHKWGIGTGDTFRQFAERQCRCDLEALFEEWVYEE